MSSLVFLIIFFIFYLGAIFGSFLNVITFELESFVFLENNFKKKFLKFWKKINRRSKCQSCDLILKPIDLFPIFSYLFLCGKCRKCKSKISSRYFFVELFTGITFLGFFYKISQNSFSEYYFFQNNVISEFLFFIPIISAIVIIFLFDLKHKIIPDIILIPVTIYSIIFITFDFQKMIFDFSHIFSDIHRSFLFALPFLAIWFISKGRAMGFADWKLIFFLSLFLDNSMTNLLFVFGAFWVGAIYAIPSLILKTKNLKGQIPFGPFIIISFVLVYVFNLSYYQFMNLLTF